MIVLISALIILVLSSGAQADWSMVRGGPEHTGFVEAEINPPFRLVWSRHFVGERMGTAFEPIVAGDKVFVTTHSGNVYLLSAHSGEPVWRFQAHGRFLNSPGFSHEIVVAADTDGWLYAIDGESGKLRWMINFGQGGFSASPVISDGTIFIGSRMGNFAAVELSSGKLLWRQNFGVPIRQTAAIADRRIFVAGEDLRVRCIDTQTGMILWISQQLVGQIARDYYPVIVGSGDRTLVVVRTNPVLNMASLIGRDRHFLCQQAGVDDSQWEKIDAWIKSDAAIGNENLWKNEQEAVIQYLEENPDSRTFFVLDAETGEEAMTAPVLWAAGCQGVGSPPVVMPDGRLLVFYRSAYGNWNHGVAPLVTLGILDLERNYIEPLSHIHGMQPPWNTFWGTADESQNFTVVGDTLIIIHQGTLSGFDLKTNKLFLIQGNRDTWGGFHNVPWARNEWHGPARGGVAVVGDRIYWQTGSRILCIAMGKQGEPAEDKSIDGSSMSVQPIEKPLVKREYLQKRLEQAVAEFLSVHWSPLYVEPGLASREFFFDHSGEVFETIAWAYPHLSPDLQERVKEFLTDEWKQNPPFAESAWYSLNEGKRRERFWIPEDILSRRHNDNLPHLFINLYPVWLYAERCDEWDSVLGNWAQLRAIFESFLETNWRLEPKQGDLLANRYLASLIAIMKIAEKRGDTETAQQAKAMAEQTAQAIIAWWQESAGSFDMPVFQNISEWDNRLGKGDYLFLKVSSHKAKLALFHDMIPEVAILIKEQASEAVDKTWDWFEVLCPTWYLVGEERQVHYGENFVDPPDLALDAFRAMAWLKDASPETLASRTDIPFCQADLTYVTKISIALEKWNMNRP